MSTPYLGELRIVSFNFAPKGWALCDGQLLPISQNQALFSLLGTTYGGNGATNFALPNLQGRIPMHMANGYPIGAAGGETFHTLSVAELPGHTHAVNATSNRAVSASPAGNVWAATSSPHYSNQSQGTMNPSTISPAGGGQPHENRPPTLVLNIAIALQGIFPSRS